MELNNGATKGLFRIPSTRINEHGVVVPGRVKMVHNLSKSSYRIKPRPTLKPALAGAEVKMQRIYERRLIEQLQRQRAFAAKGRVIL